MRTPFYLDDPDAVNDAAELMAEYGVMAAAEASARANRSRDKGNIIHFCRWRQIVRLVEWMEDAEAERTVH
ncbi:hypothetical protein HFP51_01480 [Parasphingopyxis sp. CP4]|uniref:hypothetical protein n=1 Tax=Parasphingopyxis sp. CP4 TaxID=2724527 RepID=UPI00159F9A76|nr:hypothetical protein [Parasphingopyxis sp. CP4]QLC20972.1 hypothetical protein HFP51_01480 [Parasphingopyxis sp. CP4]